MLRCATHLARAARHVRPSPRSLGWEAIRARCKAGPPRSTRTTETSRILHLITFGNKLAAYILRELGKQRPSRPLNARLRTRTKEDEGGKRQLTTSVLFLSSPFFHSITCWPGKRSAARLGEATPRPPRQVSSKGAGGCSSAHTHATGIRNAAARGTCITRSAGDPRRQESMAVDCCPAARCAAELRRGRGVEVGPCRQHRR